MLQERCVFMIDAVDRLRHVHMEERRFEEIDNEDESAKRQRLANEEQWRPLIPHPLDWIPQTASSQVRFVVSATTNSDAHRRLEKLGWNVVNLPLLDEASRRQLITKWCKARGLMVGAATNNKILQRGQTQNPFFLVQVRNLSPPCGMAGFHVPRHTLTHSR
jgi:hypothetical protein